MNTFLPDGDFGRCAFVLDNRRLNRQLTEGIQVCRIIVARSQNQHYAWLNHPVWKLWCTADGTFLLPELVTYLCALSDEWHRRPSCRKRHAWTNYVSYFSRYDPRPVKRVVWPEHVHSCMRRNLLRKDISHYRTYLKFAGLPHDEEPMEGYFWEHPRFK